MASLLGHCADIQETCKFVCLHLSKEPKVVQLVGLCSFIIFLRWYPIRVNYGLFRPKPIHFNDSFSINQVRTKVIKLTGLPSRVLSMNSYTAVNPVYSMLSSEWKCSHRYLSFDVISGGKSVPQYFPIRLEKPYCPSRIWKINNKENCHDNIHKRECSARERESEKGRGKGLTSKYVHD